MATLAIWCCNLCKTGPPDNLSLDLVRINDQLITWNVTNYRLLLWLSSNLHYLKCISGPERWLVLSSENCQLTELIRIVKTKTAGSHRTDWLTKWWKKVCWWAISAAQQWVLNYYTQRSKNGSSLFFLRHQTNGYQQSQKGNWILSVCRNRNWNTFLQHHICSKYTCFLNTAVQLSLFIHCFKQR